MLFCKPANDNKITLVVDLLLKRHWRRNKGEGHWGHVPLISYSK